MQRDERVNEQACTGGYTCMRLCVEGLILALTLTQPQPQYNHNMYKLILLGGLVFFLLSILYQILYKM